MSRAVELRFISEALDMAAYAVRHAPHQWGPQVMGRLRPDHGPGIATLLSHAEEGSRNYLVPLGRNLHQAGGPLASLLRGHRDEVHSLTILDTGEAVSCAGAAETAVWDLSHLGYPPTFIPEEIDATGLASIPGRRAVLLSIGQRSLGVLDLDSGNLEEVVADHPDLIWSIAVRSDGRVCATATPAGHRCLWDLSTGKSLNSPEHSREVATSLEFFPDGRILEGGGDAGLIWNAGFNEVIVSLDGHDGSTGPIAVLADGVHCATASRDDSTVRIWDSQQGIETACLDCGTDKPTAIAALPDGTGIAIGRQSGSLDIWELEGGQIHHLGGNPGVVDEVVASRDGRVLLTVSSNEWEGHYADNALVRVWRIDRVVPTEGTASRHDSEVFCLAATNDGRMAVSGGQNGTATVWDPATGEAAAHYDLESAVSAVAVAGDGAIVATTDGVITAGLDHTGPGTTLLETDSEPVSLALLPDGDRLAIGARDGHVHLWSLSQGRHVGKEFEGVDAVSKLAGTTDGRRIVWSDVGAELWSWTGGSKPQHLSRDSGSAETFVLLHDGRTIVSGGYSGAFYLWDAISGGPYSEIPGPESNPSGMEQIVAMDLLPSGTGVVAVNGFGHLIHADLVSGTRKLVARFTDEPSVVVALSDDLVAVAPGPTVEIWSLASGSRITSFTSDVEISSMIRASTTSLMCGDRGGAVIFLRYGGPGGTS